jgi:cytochrome b
MVYEGDRTLRTERVDTSMLGMIVYRLCWGVVRAPAGPL